MPQLPTEAEVFEGETHDIAAPLDATVNPSALRAWIATGRVRAAYRISDRARMNSEDRMFPSATASYKETVVAVEYDDLHGWLYTLTEFALYAEVPGQTPVRLDLTALFVAGETAADVKLWPADSRAFVLTNKRVMVVQGTPSTSLTMQSYTKELLANNTLVDTQTVGSINGLNAKNYRALRVAKDAATNRVMAYVTAEMTAYPVCGRPIPRLLLIGDLNSPSYAAPTFDLDPTSGVRFAFWNPIPCPPPSVSCNCSGITYSFNQYCIRDLDIGVTATRTYAYLACGPACNLVRLDVTSAATSAPPLFISVAPAGIDLLKVHADPGNAKRVFAGDLSDFYVVDISSGTPVISSCATSFGFTNTLITGPLDSAIVRTSTGTSTRLEAWTVSSGTPDYQARVFDWTTNTPSPIDQFWSANHCDGGVALPPDAIYLPNFGGVARFSPTGPNGSWIKTSYQPATSPAGPGAGVGPTEQIWLERDVAATNDHRVFTPSALGGFDEFPVNSVTKDLGPCARWQLTLPYGPFGTNVYGNDLVVARINNKPFVIVDLTDRTNMVAGLVAWGLNGSNQWVPVAAVAGTTTVNSADTTFTIHLTQDLGNTHAIVSHKYGYFFVDLRGLTNSTPTMTPLNAVIDTSRDYWGVATVKHRLFVCNYYGSSSVVDVYSWDDLTGATTPVQLNVQAGGGVPFSGGLRARYVMYNSITGCGGLHVALNNGYVVEFSQPATSAGFGSLVYANYWKSNYNGPMQDCRVYDFGFGPRILAVKDGECFALAFATSFICP